jgi:hypothetical protein
MCAPFRNLPFMLLFRATKKPAEPVWLQRAKIACEMCHNLGFHHPLQVMPIGLIRNVVLFLVIEIILNLSTVYTNIAVSYGYSLAKFREN